MRCGFVMKMPDLATTDSDIRIVRWMAPTGQKVERGQPLLEVETDKATMEVESVVSGVLGETLCQAGETVSVGQAIANLEVAGTASETTATSPVKIAGAAPPEQGAPVASQLSATTAGVAVGMFARNRAAAAFPAAAKAAIPLSVAQRVAAKRLQESKQTIPHFYLQTSVNASAMMARRKASEPAKLAWDAFFVLAASRAIAKFERFRCRLDGERLVPLETDAIGVAVDHENELYVIPVASPSAKTAERISEEIRQGAERLRRGDPEARRIHPALLTVTNLGACQVESFIPIINPPEAAVLGVGKVMAAAVRADDGRIGVEPRCTLTLSVDHRIASGKYAGDFLGAIVKELESM